jgi:hypothetical protein
VPSKGEHQVRELRELGKELRVQRTRQRLTQAQVAERAGVHRGLVSRARWWQYGPAGDAQHAATADIQRQRPAGARSLARQLRPLAYRR